MLVLLVCAAIVVVRQRQQLTEQLDARLRASMPAPGGGADNGPIAPPAGRENNVPAQPDDSPDRPTSDLYAATLLADGTVVVDVEGALLDSVPDLSAVPTPLPDRASITTVDSVDGSTEFRVLTHPRGRDGEHLVLALPVTDVNASIRALVASFAVAAALIAIALGITGWWIVRLGLRPVSTVAATARRISEGEYSERAPVADPRTEAGELATAFNVMLDERDATEERLRMFVADASHELRTPITSIRGYLDLYEQGGFREPGQLDDAVQRMQVESVRMSELVHDLLTLTRLEDCELLGADTATDVGEVVAGVVANAVVAHPDRIITYRGPEPQQRTAPWDARRVTQVVSGLVANALVHTDGDIEVTVEDCGDELVIHVIDEGPGLSDHDAARVFDRFYRADTSRSSRTGGSGLGLAIASTIVERHGGRIDLVTSPGAGCDFVVYLPGAARDV